MRLRRKGLLAICMVATMVTATACTSQAPNDQKKAVEKAVASDTQETPVDTQKEDESTEQATKDEVPATEKRYTSNDWEPGDILGADWAKVLELDFGDGSIAEVDADKAEYEKDLQGPDDIDAYIEENKKKPLYQADFDRDYTIKDGEVTLISVTSNFKYKGASEDRIDRIAHDFITMANGEHEVTFNGTMELKDTENVDKVFTYLLGNNSPVTTSEVLAQLNNNNDYVEVSSKNKNSNLNFGLQIFDDGEKVVTINFTQDSTADKGAFEGVVQRYLDNYDIAKLQKKAPGISQLLLDPTDYSDEFKKEIADNFGLIRVETSSSNEHGSKSLSQDVGFVLNSAMEGDKIIEGSDLIFTLRLDNKDATLSISKGAKGGEETAKLLPTITNELKEITPLVAWRLDWNKD